MKLPHVFLPLWACLTMGHHPNHHLGLWQGLHSLQNRLNVYCGVAKFSVSCDDVRISPIGHRPIEKAREPWVVQVVVHGRFKKKEYVALMQTPVWGTLKSKLITIFKHWFSRTHLNITVHIAAMEQYCIIGLSRPCVRIPNRGPQTVGELTACLGKIYDI